MPSCPSPSLTFIFAASYNKKQMITIYPRRPIIMFHTNQSREGISGCRFSMVIRLQFENIEAEKKNTFSLENLLPPGVCPEGG